jgi:hypothetical protein
MAFVGIKDQAEAKNLWVYLKQFGMDGMQKAASGPAQPLRLSGR